jgi:hypothetical protein
LAGVTADSDWSAEKFVEHPSLEVLIAAEFSTVLKHTHKKERAHRI